MSKELNIIEASNMPVGTEFEVVYSNGKKEMVFIDSFGIFPYSKNDACMMSSSLSLINAKFIPVNKPVNFMEAVKAFDKGKRIKSVLPNGAIQHYSIEYKMQLLDDENGLGVTSDEILNGKWYIED